MVYYFCVHPKEGWDIISMIPAASLHQAAPVAAGLAMSPCTTEGMEPAPVLSCWLVFLLSGNSSGALGVRMIAGPVL